MNRRTVRILLLALAVPLLLFCAVLAVKLASLQVIASAAVSQYEAGAFDASAETAESLMQVNEFEPWIAYFDRGTARAVGGNYNESIDDLERAFDLAPQERRCDVALNLSLAWESLGDEYLQQGQFAGARKLYDLARAALDAAGDGCGGPPTEADRADPVNPDGGGEPDPRSRLDDKSTRAQELDEQAEAREAPGEFAPLDELQQQGDAAAGEKERQQRQRDTAPGLSRPGDKPW